MAGIPNLPDPLNLDLAGGVHQKRGVVFANTLAQHFKQAALEHTRARDAERDQMMKMGQALLEKASESQDPDLLRAASAAFQAVQTGKPDKFYKLMQQAGDSALLDPIQKDVPSTRDVLDAENKQLAGGPPPPKPGTPMPGGPPPVMDAASAQPAAAPPPEAPQSSPSAPGAAAMPTASPTQSSGPMQMQVPPPLGAGAPPPGGAPAGPPSMPSGVPPPGGGPPTPGPPPAAGAAPAPPGAPGAAPCGPPSPLGANPPPPDAGPGMPGAVGQPPPQPPTALPPDVVDYTSYYQKLGDNWAERKKNAERMRNQYLDDERKKPMFTRNYKAIHDASNRLSESIDKDYVTTLSGMQQLEQSRMPVHEAAKAWSDNLVKTHVNNEQKKLRLFDTLAQKKALAEHSAMLAEQRLGLSQQQFELATLVARNKMALAGEREARLSDDEKHLMQRFRAHIQNSIDARKFSQAVKLAELSVRKGLDIDHYSAKVKNSVNTGQWGQDTDPDSIAKVVADYSQLVGQTFQEGADKILGAPVGEAPEIEGAAPTVAPPPARPAPAKRGGPPGRMFKFGGKQYTWDQLPPEGKQKAQAAGLAP